MSTGKWTARWPRRFRRSLTGGCRVYRGRLSPASSSGCWILVTVARSRAGATSRSCCCLAGSACGSVRWPGLSLATLTGGLGEIVVRGKGRRRDRLPLPAAVGEAVAAYLHDGRPRDGRGPERVRERARAPPGAGPNGRRQDRRCCGAACWVGQGRRSPASTHGRDRDAASRRALAEIGQLLRHRSAMSTAIYAKVDHGRLRSLARSWPAVRAEFDGERLRPLARAWPGGV